MKHKCVRVVESSFLGFFLSAPLLAHPMEIGAKLRRLNPIAEIYVMHGSFHLGKRAFAGRSYKYL